MTIVRSSHNKMSSMWKLHSPTRTSKVCRHANEVTSTCQAREDEAVKFFRDLDCVWMILQMDLLSGVFSFSFSSSIPPRATFFLFVCNISVCSRFSGAERRAHTRMTNSGKELNYFNLTQSRKPFCAVFFFFFFFLVKSIRFSFVRFRFEYMPPAQ
jgi:hypothetical protein